MKDGAFFKSKLTYEGCPENILIYKVKSYVGSNCSKRNNQDLSKRRCEQQHIHFHSGWRDPCYCRREWCRENHVDENTIRSLPARLGYYPDQWRTSTLFFPTSCDRKGDPDGAPTFHAGTFLYTSSEHRVRSGTIQGRPC